MRVLPEAARVQAREEGGGAMSDCRVPMAPYGRPSELPPIEGALAYVDGTKSRFTFARLVNGKARIVDHVEVDGARYARVAERGWDDCEVD